MNKIKYKREEFKYLKWALNRIVDRRRGKVPAPDLDSIKKTYEHIWKNKHGDRELEYSMPGRVNGKCMLIRQADVRKKRVNDIAEEVNDIHAESVMELGSGYGINLLAIAVLCPAVKQIKGVELSDEGVKQFHNSLQNLPVNYLEYITGKDEAYIRKRIEAVQFEVLQGDMFCFRDGKKYDVVFTNAAIEQTGESYPLALKTAKLHSKKRCVFVEQFREAQNPLQRLMLIAKDYFRAPYSCVEDAGMEIVKAYKWPIEKMVHGWGVVVADV